jgi:glucosamine-6-phosphate deaminase
VKYGKTEVVVCDSYQDVGRRAAKAFAQAMREYLAKESEIRAVFAAGESQTPFLSTLASEPGIDWHRVVCFNLDDFWDPKMPAQFSCVYQTHKQLYDKVHPKRIDFPHFDAPDPQVEADRFANVLRQAGKIHVLCQGIGTSGHLALNEPGQTDLEDSKLVRVVHLVETSKNQLRSDPNFSGLGYVPNQGITMTIPALMSAQRLFAVVPLALKRPILSRLFSTRMPTPDLPASILFARAGTLYVDTDSCPAEYALQ